MKRITLAQHGGGANGALAWGAFEMNKIDGAVESCEPVISRELKAVPPFSFGAVRTFFMGGLVAL